MADKLFVRRCEKFTQWTATQPIEVDVEKLRKCDPPYEGNTEQELFDYLNENIWEEWDGEFVNNDHNKEVYGEGLEYLALEDGYFDMEVYADSREKFGDSWMELGVPNEEYRKTGGFKMYVSDGE